MSRRRRIGILVLSAPLLLAMVVTSAGAASDSVESEKVILKIEGMTWATWPLIIKKALEGLDGVEKAVISYKEKRGEVYFQRNRVTESEIVAKINEIGFKASLLGQWPSDEPIFERIDMLSKR